jgi:hypothetical protein
MRFAERIADPGFGNAMLNGLQEITLPEPPSYRPRTIGWAILLAIALVALLIWGLRFYQTWRRNRYRRLALKRLTELGQAVQVPDSRIDALKELPVLVKQTALAGYPRDQVAQLTGDRWLAFLDRTYQGQAFTQGMGRLLSSLAYQPTESWHSLSAHEVDGLIALIRDWILSHRPAP